MDGLKLKEVVMQKESIIYLRVSKKEHDDLLKAAKADDRTLSAYCRRILARHVAILGGEL